MLYFNSVDIDDDGRFVYASCDDACTNPANWVREMPDVPAAVDYLVNNLPYFALAPDGTPAFVYQTQEDVNYAYRSGGRWAVTGLGKADFDDPSLVFTSTSQPRVVARSRSNDDEHLVYLECSDLTCANTAFANLPVKVGYYVNAVLRLNAQNAPRLLYYTDEETVKSLQYLSCDATCTNAASWNVSAVGTEEGYGGDGIALVLDGAGQPHISYGDASSTDLFYGLCSAACESANASWQLGLLVESSDAVEMDVAPPLPSCEKPTSFWYAGNAPSLVLNGNKPSFTYQVRNLQACDGKLAGSGPSIVRFSNATPKVAQTENGGSSLEPLRQFQNAAAKGKAR